MKKLIFAFAVVYILGCAVIANKFIHTVSPYMPKIAHKFDKWLGE